MVPRRLFFFLFFFSWPFFFVCLLPCTHHQVIRVCVRVRVRVCVRQYCADHGVMKQHHIAKNSTVMKIAENKPRSEAELRRIEGIGQLNDHCYWMPPPSFSESRLTLPRSLNFASLSLVLSISPHSPSFSESRLALPRSLSLASQRHAHLPAFTVRTRSL